MTGKICLFIFVSVLSSLAVLTAGAADNGTDATSASPGGSTINTTPVQPNPTTLVLTTELPSGETTESPSGSSEGTVSDGTAQTSVTEAPTVSPTTEAQTTQSPDVTTTQSPVVTTTQSPDVTTTQSPDVTTTQTPGDVTTGGECPSGGGFRLSSFIGGIVLVVGIILIIAIFYKIWSCRKADHPYREF